MGTNMRDGLELLKIIYNGLLSCEEIDFGLCNYVYSCVVDKKISVAERIRLTSIIRKHIVSKASSDNCTDERCIKTEKYRYYWPPGDITPRLKYLEYLIELYSKATDYNV